MSTALRLVPAEAPDTGTVLRLAGEALVRLGSALAAMAPSATTAPGLQEWIWIKPDAAATIAGLDLSTAAARRRARARIYSWARGKSWATRPTTRTLLIDELRFRRWLGAHRDQPEVES